MYVPDSYDAWETHERHQEAQLADLPVCDHCDHPIQAEKYHDIDGRILCPTCLIDHYTKYTEDFIS